MVPKIFENNFICDFIWKNLVYMYKLINGNEFDSRKWLEMIKNVCLDFTERQLNGIWVVYKIWLVYVLVNGFFDIQTVYIYTWIYGANSIWFGVWPQMTIFYWYTTSIWHHGIYITIFFAVLKKLLSWSSLLQGLQLQASHLWQQWPKLPFQTLQLIQVLFSLFLTLRTQPWPFHS